MQSKTQTTKQMAVNSLQDMLLSCTDNFKRFAKEYPIARKLLIGVSAGVAISLIRNISIAYNRWRDKSPPGLLGIPFFGSFITMLSYKDQFYYELLPSCGPITTHFIGKEEFITLHDINLIEKVFGHECCIKRPYNHRALYVEIDMVPSVIAANNDELWLKRKNLVMTAIENLDKQFLDEIVYKLLCENTFKEMQNASLRNIKWESRIEIKKLCNILSWNVVFAQKYQLFDSENKQAFNENLHLLNVKIEKIFDSATIALFARLFPSMLGLEKLLIGKSIKTFEKYCMETMDYVKGQVNNAITLKGLGAGNDKKRTYFDEIYDEYVNDLKHSTRANPRITQDMLNADIWLVIVHATKLVSCNMEAALIYLANEPIIQQEVYDELILKQNKNDKNSNNEFYAKYVSSNIVNCPKFRAFVHETLRVLCVFPRALSHQLTKTCKLSYDITEDGQCVDIEFVPLTTHQANMKSTKQFEYIISDLVPIDANMLLVGAMDKKLWPDHIDPTKFDIRNWLTSDEYGKTIFKQNRNAMPFGYGGRDCVGKKLAINQLYSMLSHIIVNYKLSVSEEVGKKDIRYVEGISRAIDPQLPMFVEKRR